MRTIEEIITDLKHNIYWSQPNIKFNELSALVAELENTLSSPEVIVEETIVEETVVEETITEEPVVVKKTTRKK